MANVNNDVTVTLSQEDKELLIKAIKTCEQIAKNCNYNCDMFIDAGTVFAEISAEISGRKNCKVAIICSGRLRFASLPAQKSLSSGRRSRPCGLKLEGLRPLQASRGIVSLCKSSLGDG